MKIMKCLCSVMTVLFVVSIGVGDGFAFSLEVTPPVLPGSGALIDGINTDLANATALLKVDAADILSKYGYTPKLTKGFANASVYSAHAATQRGIQANKLMVSVGTMIGAHAPTTDLSYYKDFDAAVSAGDIEGGVAFTPVAVQAGMNTDFLLPDLFLAVRLGKLSYEIDVTKLNISCDVFNLGLLANYSLIKKKSLPLGVMSWGGLTLGTGILYHSNKVKFYKTIDPLLATTSISYLTYTGRVTVDPSIAINVDTYALILPLEAMTSLKIAFLNIAGGAGVDLCTGGSEVSFATTGNVSVDGTLGTIALPGTIAINASTEGDGPSTVRTKLMANIGLCFGPVFLDVPVTWYLKTGASLGLTLGVSF